MSEYDYSSIFKKKFISSDFKTLLNQVNKEELEYCKILIRDKKSTLKKADLIDFYYENYHLLLEDILTSFHSEILDFIYLIVDNNGELEYDDFNPFYAILIKMFLIAFPVIKDNKYKLVMANDVLELFKKYDKKEFYEKVKLNDLVVQYTRGLLSLYGQFETDLIFQYIKEFEGFELNSDEFYLLLNNDGLFYGFDFDDFDEIIYSFQLPEISEFEETREKHDSLDYYHLTKKEIIEQRFYLNSVTEEFTNFLFNNLEMPLELANKFLGFATEAINFNISLKELINMFKSLDLTIFERKQLDKILEKMYYNTRIWSLKGHTRTEIKIPKLIKFERK